MQTNDDWTHIPVKKSLREQLRKEADANNLTYTGLLERLLHHGEDTIQKSDADYLIEKFAESVADVTDHSSNDVEEHVREKLQAEADR